MVPKSVLAAAVGVILLVPGHASFAAGYKPGDFLGLDLSKALLSPQPLGPPTQFGSFPVEASGEGKKASTQASVEAEPKADIKVAPAARKVRTARVHTEKLRTEKRRGAA